MKIEINYNKTKYTIDVEPSCFTPYRDVIIQEGKNKGKSTPRALGYYNMLSNAIDAIIRTEMYETDETVSLKEYVERYENAFKEIQNHCDGKNI